jgi:hypothetical protein
MSDFTTFIYVLCDPVTQQIRYVGKADYPQERFKRHLLPQDLNANTHKARWIRLLLANGLNPEMFILAQVSKADWQEQERFWIKQLRSIGAPLTNSTNGGDGVLGLKRSRESIESGASKLRGRTRPKEVVAKISSILRGRRMPQEQREKLSEIHKTRWENMSQSQRDAFVAKMPREWTDESKEKLSKTRTGQKRGKNTSSPYVGVVFYKRYSKWRAYIMANKKQLHLGYFDTPEEAHEVYKKAHVDRFGEFSPYYEDAGTPINITLRRVNGSWQVSADGDLPDLVEMTYWRKD